MRKSRLISTFFLHLFDIFMKLYLKNVIFFVYNNSGTIWYWSIGGKLMPMCLLFI